MKKTTIALGLILACLSINPIHSQINLGEKTIGALKTGYKGFTFSDEDAQKLSKEAVAEMDKTNPTAAANDPYSVRLNRVFGKYKSEDGLSLNYKVYKVKDVNAFATADGSVRVFAGLMDIMDDNELLAVIGHEIGHVAKHHSREAAKAAYKKEALIGLAASQNDKVASLSESQLAKIGSAMIDSKHSRKQESEADSYAYEFLKKHNYDVNAEESAFNLLSKMSSSTESSTITKMMASHPDAKERAEIAKTRAEKDGLYKPYVAKIVSKTTKKTKAKKKK